MKWPNGCGLRVVPRSVHAAPERRVWPGQALEGAIVRPVLPAYPLGTKTRDPVSVFVEYLITLDGSVKVLRTSGPTAFTSTAHSVLERWVYRPMRFESRLGYRSQAGGRGCQGESKHEPACAIAVDQPVTRNVREMRERPDCSDRPIERG